MVCSLFHCHSSSAVTRKRAWTAIGAGIDEKLFALPDRLLESLKHNFHVSYVGILFYLVNLILMNKTLDVGTLLDKSGTHEINVARLQVHYDVEDDNNKEICFVRSLTLSSV